MASFMIKDVLAKSSSEKTITQQEQIMNLNGSDYPEFKKSKVCCSKKLIRGYQRGKIRQKKSFVRYECRLKSRHICMHILKTSFVCYECYVMLCYEFLSRIASSVLKVNCY